MSPRDRAQRRDDRATIEVRDNTVGGGHLCKGLLSGQQFRLRAEVPPGTRKVTVLGKRPEKEHMREGLSLGCIAVVREASVPDGVS